MRFIKGGACDEQFEKKLITKIIAHTILILGAVIMLVPFFWMLSSSFKTLGEVFVFPPTLFGERLVWENYTQISSRFDYFAYFLNSIKVSAWVVFFRSLLPPRPAMFLPK